MKRIGGNCPEEILRMTRDPRVLVKCVWMKNGCVAWIGMMTYLLVVCRPFALGAEPELAAVGGKAREERVEGDQFAWVRVVGLKCEC